jgi:hypothetical protein
MVTTVSEVIVQVAGQEDVVAVTGAAAPDPLLGLLGVLRKLMTGSLQPRRR